MPHEKNEPGLADLPLKIRAKRHYEVDFLARYEYRFLEISQLPLVILIWGPGQGGGDLYEKRLQIRGRLRQLGHAAVFSEEIDEDFPAPDFSAKTREFVQALEADFVVVLQASPGSIAEAHDFADFIHSLGSKMLIFIDERAEQGYSYTGALQDLRTLYNNVRTYEYPRDIEECKLLGSVIERVNVIQAVKWRRQYR